LPSFIVAFDPHDHADGAASTGFAHPLLHLLRVDSLLYAVGVGEAILKLADSVVQPHLWAFQAPRQRRRSTQIIAQQFLGLLEFSKVLEDELVGHFVGDDGPG
jgi:hypothetical protein